MRRSPSQVGNASATRLGLMTGSQQVSSTHDALAELEAALAAGRVPTALPLAALDRLPIPPSGLALQLDADAVACQHVVIRKIVDPQHGPGLELRFKLRRRADARRVVDALRASGGHTAPMTVEKMSLDGQGRYAIDPARDGYTIEADPPADASPKPAKSTVVDARGRYQVAILDEHAPQAVRGLVRLRVFEAGHPKNLNANLAEALVASELGATLAASSEGTRARFNQLRVLWQRDPKKAQALAEKKLAGPAIQHEIDAALAAAGVDPERAARLETQEVFPGHFTTVDPTQGERYRKLGVAYLFTGARSARDVVAVLAGDGLMSTNERHARGLIIRGSASAVDISSGGADYVFTRMVTKDAAARGDLAMNEMTLCFCSGDYQLIFGTDVLNRTDWFAYESDSHGATNDLQKFTARKEGAELIDGLRTGYDGQFAFNNEVMFQRGLSSRDVIGVFTYPEEKKQDLIEALTAAGITQIAGRPLDEAIQVRTQMVL